MATSAPLADDSRIQIELESQGSAKPLAADGNLQRQERWQARLDRLTTIGVNVSTIAFVGLQVPQIIQNFVADPDKMRDLAWPGFVSGSMGNLLLVTYFAGVPEWAAVRVQIVGAITNYFVATQVFLAGYFPAPQFWTLATILIIGLLVPLLYAVGVLSPDRFAQWKEATTPLGLSALVFSVTATFTQDSLLLLAVALAGLVSGMVLLALKNRFPALAAVTAKLGGWLATFLFMFMPIPQIVKTIAVGRQAAEAFSMGFTVLATIGNGLGATRAFVIRETVWFTGSFWGLMVGGWAMAVAVCAVNPVQCPLWALVGYTVLLLTYFLLVVAANGRAKQEGLCRQLAFLWGR